MKDSGISINLDMIEREDVPRWKSFELASTITQESVSRGDTTATAYSRQAVRWLKKAMEAAKELMVMQTLSRQEMVGQGEHQLMIPLKTLQMQTADWEASSAEYTTANTDVLFTDILYDDGIFFTPTGENYSIAITNEALRKNIMPLVQKYQEDLAYRMSWVIDNALVQSISSEGSGAGSGGNTEMAYATQGMQTIFGGDATNTDDALDVGDVMSTAVIKKAKRLLNSDIGYFWQTHVFTPSTVAKNPWTSEPTAPFYALIRPESEEALLSSSQFTNAAEYGSDGPVLNGAFAKYAGFNFVTSTMLRTKDADGNYYVQGVDLEFDTNVHETFFFKANTASALVWGQKPKFHIFDYPSQLQKRMVVEMAYTTGALQYDATVCALVTND